MSEEILINVTPQESRVAIVENGVLQEVFVERLAKRGLVGNIYKGSVSRVLPGMQASFIEIGLPRTAFLHAADIPVSVDVDGTEESHKTKPIEDLIGGRKEILVQVIKDPLGTKGARLTAQLSLPSRYLVLLIDNPTIGISQKITDEEERLRVKSFLEQQQTEEHPHGFIVRTAAEGVSEEELLAEVAFLRKLWAEVQINIEQTSPANVVHEDLLLPMRTIRDYLTTTTEKVRVDSLETFQKIKSFVSKLIPELSERIEHYPGERPIFDLYNVDDEIKKALGNKVSLKSGGYLVVDQTEAMTTIDVNTGGFVGHRNISETIFKTNLEAAQAVARQLRLRNLGGIIVIDFIDMSASEHKEKVIASLEKYLGSDKTKCQISEVSSLGLVEMTRKRTRESLGQILCETCPTCEGLGVIKTAETVCYEVFREIMRSARQFEARQYLVLAASEVVDLMLDEEAQSVAQLEEFIGCQIRLQVESYYTQDQYDVVLT